MREGVIYFSCLQHNVVNKYFNKSDDHDTDDGEDKNVNTNHYDQDDDNADDFYGNNDDDDY